ncbi:MAG: hypothetical protein O6952_07300, partial [Planctomycetota bacterium]|nr:hypothetical protein [Planctomycetota bacterium]
VMITAFGTVGSILFALPMIVNEGTDHARVLGLTLLDVIDHWSFKYGLLVAGLVECVLIAWIFGARRLVNSINETSRIPLGTWFVVFVQLVLPLLLVVVIGWSIKVELEEGTLYGSGHIDNFAALGFIGFAVWVLGTLGGAFLLTRGGGKEVVADA